jgi:hypothetical protein
MIKHKLFKITLKNNDVLLDIYVAWHDYMLVPGIFKIDEIVYKIVSAEYIDTVIVSESKPI